MLDNYNDRSSWQFKTIIYIASKKHRSKMSKSEKQNRNLKLENFSKEKSVRKTDNTRSNSFSECSLLSKIKKSLDTNIQQNYKPLNMEEENIK